jgi:hypothetical protein
MPAPSAPRPHDDLIEPIYSGLREERGGTEPTPEPPRPGPGAAWAGEPAPPREPAGVGGLCGLVILLVALIVVGSLAVILFGSSE